MAEQTKPTVTASVDTMGTVRFHNLSRAEYELFPSTGAEDFYAGSKFWSKTYRFPNSDIEIVFFTYEPPTASPTPDETSPTAELVSEMELPF